MPEEEYWDIASDSFSNMRLLIEGAISLFEDESGVLISLTTKANMPDAYNAVNDIGSALYELRQHIRLLREAHCKYTTQSLGSAPQDPGDS